MAIKKTDIKKIRSDIIRAARPIVFYDDDPDGLCSYLLVKHLNPNTIGVRAATGPILDSRLKHKITENAPDLIIILDKPKVEDEFLKGIRTPIIWVDHHDVEKIKHPKLKYYNPRINNRTDKRPVSYWMWRITQGPLWIATIGVTSDYDNSLLIKFNKEYPNLNKHTVLEKTIYESKLGELIRKFTFLMKGNNQQIIKNISVLSKIKDPYELIELKTAKSKYLEKQASKIKEEYEKQLKEAMKTRVNNGVYVHIFKRVKISLVRDLANEIMFRKKAKLYIIGREENNRINFSARTRTLNLPKRIQKALEGIDGYGGGHLRACGGSINKQDWNEFLNKLIKQIRT